MSWRITPTQPIPAVIGEPFGGGFFAGYISHTADGSPTHALIVAPRATGATGSSYTLTTDLALKTSDTATAGATSEFDGLSNTTAMVTAGIADHPAAQFCVNLSISGYADWFLPSRYELEIAYFNLKPTSDANSTGSGSNLYSVPPKAINYTSSYPARTDLTLFNSSTQGFTATNHWVSTSIRLNFTNGTQAGANRTTLYSVRAFRRIAL